MNILVVTTMAPFIRGDAEELADHLVANLRRFKGVEAELLRIPFAGSPYNRIADQVMLCRMLELHTAERVIALKFPAYLIPHEHKTLWLSDRHRQAYDLFERGEMNMPDDDQGTAIRRIIKTADDACFGALNGRIFVTSAVTRERLQRFNGCSSIVLPPPLNDPEIFADISTGDYIFAGGPVNGAKRQHLLIEAMKLCKSGVRLIVGGPPDSPADAERLRKEAADDALEGKVILDLGFLDRAKLAAYVSNALACAYLPLDDEDSDSYVAMEALQARKAVITVTDAGGVLDIVSDGATGCVTEPTPHALAEAMDRLYLDKRQAKEYGHAGHELWASRNITWAATVERLLS
jgi:glycosyltransferase involved in cell wall biosynthesis